MILGTIMSNMSSGIAGAAAKGKQKASPIVDSKGFQLIAGKHEHNAKIDAKYDKQRAEGKRGTALKSVVHKGFDNLIAADYKDQGLAKQVGVAGLRQGAGAIASMPLEGAYRYATGTGTFTEKDGKRDIAGIPFI